MNTQNLRDMKWFRSLRKRDFDNGATLEEIEHVFKAVDHLQDKLDARDGYLASLADSINAFAREEGTAECDALDNDLRPFLDAIVYRLRQRIVKAQQACQDRDEVIEIEHGKVLQLQSDKIPGKIIAAGFGPMPWIDGDEIGRKDKAYMLVEVDLNTTVRAGEVTIQYVQGEVTDERSEKTNV